MKRTQAWLSLFALGVMLLGCPPSNEGLLVNVQTEFTPVLEFDAVRISLDERTRDEVAVHALDRFVDSRRVASYGDVPPGRRRVTVELLDDRVVVVSRVAEFEFSGSYLLNVVLSRSCAGVRCNLEETCVGSVCVPSTCVTGYEVSCPPATCAADSACRTPVACADARCVEGFCVSFPNNDRCAAGEVCRADMGCVMRPIEPDAGRADAGEITACGGRPVGTVCRPAAGVCDVAEVCDGVSTACPADAFAPGHPVCRGAFGPCDEVETCPGNSPHCTTDVVKNAGEPCRGIVQQCDEAEFCDGVNAECPGDGFRANGTPCDTGACGSETCQNGVCSGGGCTGGWECCGDTCAPCGCTGCGKSDPPR